MEQSFKMNENSILATTNPFLLSLMIAIFVLVGIICVRTYRNTNDFAKSVKLYIPSMIVLNIIIIVTSQLDLLLVIGGDFCGFFAMVFASNYYFYH